MGVDGSFMHTMLTGGSRLSAFMWGGGGALGEDPQGSLTGYGTDELFISLLMGIGNGRGFSQNECAVSPDFHKAASEQCDEVETGPDLAETEGNISAAKRGSVLNLVMAPTKTDGLYENETQYSYYAMSECKDAWQNEGAEPAITLGEDSEGCDKKNENGLTRAWTLMEPTELAANEEYHRDAGSQITISNENSGYGEFILTSAGTGDTGEGVLAGNGSSWRNEGGIDSPAENVSPKNIIATAACDGAIREGNIFAGNRQHSINNDIAVLRTLSNEIVNADKKKLSGAENRNDGESRVSDGKAQTRNGDVIAEHRAPAAKTVYVPFDSTKDSFDTNALEHGDDIIPGSDSSRDAIIVNQLNKQESALIRNIDSSPRSGNGITGFESTKPLESSVLTQLVDNAVLYLKKDQSEIVIQLKPEALGKVKMRVSSDDRHISIRIVTETPIARDLIDNSFNQLKSALHDQGLDIEDFHVVVADNFEGAGQEFESEKQSRVAGGSDEGELDTMSCVDNDETEEINPDGIGVNLVNCFA